MIDNSWKALVHDARVNSWKYRQPTVVIDPSTRREKVDDVYWSIYKKNPFNRINTRSQWLEQSLDDKGSEIEAYNKNLEWKNILPESILRIWKNKHRTRKASIDDESIKCYRCGFDSVFGAVHCFHCLEKLNYDYDN